MVYDVTKLVHSFKAAASSRHFPLSSSHCFTPAIWLPFQIHQGQVLPKINIFISAKQKFLLLGLILFATFLTLH